MKGDLILLGITAAAILVIPMSVAGSSMGTPPTTVSSGEPSSASNSYVTTPIPGGLPAIAQPTPQPSEPTADSSSSSVPTSAASKPDRTAASSKYKLPVKTLRVLNRSTGKVDELSVRDYVRGAIAAEMPASYHLEALKAQGVAALTYALYHYGEQQKNPDPLLGGAYFSADPDKREGYMTEREAKKFYGDNADYNWGKVCDAADEAMKWVMLYEGSPIAAAYHAISAGSTEDAINIWQGTLPCLTAVDSSWDILAKGYQSTAILTQAEIKAKLADSGAKLLPNPDTWFEVEKTSPSGYVTQVRVGSATMSGNQLRNLLGLRSSSFRIERQGKDFIFYVSGYGHGAGLSQNGADYMARQGRSFDEILTHYYNDCTLAEAG